MCFESLSFYYNLEITLDLRFFTICFDNIKYFMFKYNIQKKKMKNGNLKKKVKFSICSTFAFIKFKLVR